eukprot:9048424-Pyramimonas_sp.AAC.1
MRMVRRVPGHALPSLDALHSGLQRKRRQLPVPVEFTRCHSPHLLLRRGRPQQVVRLVGGAAHQGAELARQGRARGSALALSPAHRNGARQGRARHQRYEHQPLRPEGRSRVPEAIDHRPAAVEGLEPGLDLASVAVDRVEPSAQVLQPAARVAA